MTKSNGDNQFTGMAGEFLVVGQLFKRKLQASVTLGNAKAIDVLAYNPRTERSFPISVKTLRKGPNCFRMSPSAVAATHTYVFVVLNEPGAPERYFIVPGEDLVTDLRAFFGASLDVPDSKQPAVNYGPLKPYEGNWQLFEESGHSSAVERALSIAARA